MAFSLAEARSGLPHGDPRAIAKTLRAVDDRAAWIPELFSELHATLAAKRSTAHVIGITGSPGAGKSTVVDALIGHYRAEQKRVGVIAVDPTSPFTGGAILGDRIRMRAHSTDEGVFIRSLATRGALGGLSKSAAESVNVMLAAGFDVVLLETVGVGQDEVDVFKVAQSVVVVLTPGMGDDIQAIKAGILEIADVYLVNKADREGAHKLVSDLKSMLTLVPHPDEQHLPPVIEAIATEKKGIDTLAAALAMHLVYLRETEAGRRRESKRLADAFLQLFRNEAVWQVEQRAAGSLDAARDRVAAGDDPYQVTAELMRRVFGG
jgi:LAO/AO transport system kinase